MRQGAADLSAADKSDFLARHVKFPKKLRAYLARQRGSGQGDRSPCRDCATSGKRGWRKIKGIEPPEA
jgi:hypothetical protein